MLARRHLLALGAAATLPLAARAQANWPDRPVRFVVPFPAGSTPDMLGRVLTPHFTSVFGQSFIVDNKAGAGGNLGTDAVAKATDGHVLGLTINGPLTTAPALYPHLPYDPVRDLVPISLAVRYAQILVVHPAIPANSAAEFVAYAKANPGLISYGSPGPGSGAHLAMEEVAAKNGLKMEHVSYRGFPQAVLDLVAGRIHAMILTSAAVLPQVKAGQVRALAVTSEARIPQLPDVPTMTEIGMPEATSYSWNAIIAPVSTPAERVERLSAEVKVALTLPQNRSTLEAAGFEIVASTPAEARAFLEAETLRWGGMIRRLGITADS